MKLHASFRSIFTIRPARLALACLASATLGLTPAVSLAETVVGSGHVISEKRTVSGFHGVVLSGSGNLAVTQGDTEGLVIEAEDNLLPLIDSTVGSDGILHLGFKEHQGSVETHKTILFKLSAKNLDRLVSNGSGSAHADSLSADSLRLELHGSGNITVDHLKTGTANLQIAGSGKVKLSGEAHEEKADVNGSGAFEAEDLKAESATIHINGSGNAKVRVSGSLSVEVNGSGSLGYYGSPTVKKTIHGSGEVEALGERQ